MEDFSSILWVVIIVAAMIFNSVSKARRARGKGGNTPPQHGEAWPSIPWDDTQDDTQDAPQKPAAPTPQTAHPKIPVPKPIPVPPPISHNKRIPVPETPRQWAESPFERGEIPEKREALESPTPRPAAFGSGNGDSVRTVSPEPPVFTEFPDECQSLEVIPTEEGQSEQNAAESAVGAGFRKEQADRGKKSGAAAATAKTPKSGDSKEGVSEWAEEFDLRRAVIYSEILKPKFEE